jgi:hypothetical protein
MRSVMAVSMHNLYTQEARAQWDRMRFRAFWHTFQAALGQQPIIHPFDFTDVTRRLRLKNTVYRGVQNIPVENIVGSMGRYQDFTRTFLPINDHLAQRWQEVAALSLDPERGVPPIEVYKVFDWYFVKDGNHRVSVARQLKMNVIEAYVWEYTDPPRGCSESGADIEGMLLAAEHADFLEETRLDVLHAEHTIELNQLGGYHTLLEQIEQYSTVICAIDGGVESFDDVVLAWYEMAYETGVEFIRQSGVMSMFPKHSEADLYVWIMRHQQQMREAYGGRVRVLDAARAWKRSKRSWLPIRVYDGIKGSVKGIISRRP